MKQNAFVILLLALAASTPGYAQMGGSGAPAGSEPSDEMSSLMNHVHPAASATPSAVTAGQPLDAHLTAEAKGKTPATAFAASIAKIYLPWSDGAATKGEKLRAVWIVDDTGPKFTKHQKITENTQTLPGPAVGSFSLAAEGKLLPGKYHVDLYEGSKLSKTIPFTITK